MTDKKYHAGEDLEACCKMLDIDLGLVLEKSGIELNGISMKRLMLTAKQIGTFVSVITTEYGCDDIHIKLANGFAKNPIGISHLAFSSSATVKDGIERIVKIKPTTLPVFLKMNTDSTGVALSMHQVHPDFPIDGVLEIITYFWIAYSCKKYTLKNIAPRRIVISSEIPYKDKIETELGCQVEVSSHNAIEFDAETIALPLITTNNYIADVIDQELLRRVEADDSSLSIAKLAEQIIQRILPSGNVTAHRVSNELALSKRTFERRLSNEGITFSKLLEKIKTDLALEYLSNQDYSISEISFMLGFEEPNSFFRAFKKWHGSTPKQFRTSLVSEPIIL